jgi:nucleotide-binding universal stress UspA family protein
MYHHILIPTDGSPLSAAAVEKTMAFARHAGAKVTMVTVTEPFHVFSVDPEQLSGTEPEYLQHAKEQAARHLGDAELIAKRFGVHCETVQVEHVHPYQAIIDVAAKKGCDLIAMASHGRRGVAALVLGSETTKVLTHSKLPVLVYR